MRVNITHPRPIRKTAEGGPSVELPPLAKLKRLTMACMLWEKTFYVDGVDVVQRIAEVAAMLKPQQICDVASDCHKKGLLRHIPLYLIVQALKKQAQCKKLIQEVCNRPDQMTELLALYWKDGKKPLPAQLKKGLAAAFNRFDEYQLAKYNRDNPIKLRDILFLCHAKPKNDAQADLWKRLISNTMKTPETWETKLSAGNDKKETFAELLEKGKMGKLAIIRNLRNMHDSGVSKLLVKENLMKSDRPILPFQFLAAARECPQWEDIVDEAMLKSLETRVKIPGSTIILVDVSGSMMNPISSKSTMSCHDAAAGVAILLREICDSCEVWTFSNAFVQVAPRRGMALRDAIRTSQPCSGTFLSPVLNYLKGRVMPDGSKIDRLVVITDEQIADAIPDMTNVNHCYINNIASNEYGIKTFRNWLGVTGFSEYIIDFITGTEELECSNQDASSS